MIFDIAILLLVLLVVGLALFAALPRILESLIYTYDEWMRVIEAIKYRRDKK